MAKGLFGMAKCICTGLFVGAAVGVVVCQSMKSDRGMKKKAKKALHAMEDMMEDIQYMFK